MTGGEEERKKGEGKGFAGLSSLVSDVDTTSPPAPKTETTASAPSTERPAPQAVETQPSQPNQTYQEPAQPSSSGSSSAKWVLGIAAVIGVLWLIGQSDKSPTSPDPAYSPPAQTTTPSYSPPAEPLAPSRPQESIPPVGQDLVFSTDQIRYCLAEDIRMEGAKSAVNKYMDSDVDRFNAMVADYNSRCGSFRYRGGALESARQDIEPYRGQLHSEGRGRFFESSPAGSLSNLPLKPKLENTKYLNSESFLADDEKSLKEFLAFREQFCTQNAKCEFDKFRLERVDIDLDGKAEYFVTHDDYCGSAGCSVFLFRKSSTAGWQQIASAFGQVRIGDEQINGYRNLLVTNKIYRSAGGFDLNVQEYAWDGDGYRIWRKLP